VAVRAFVLVSLIACGSSEASAPREEPIAAEPTPEERAAEVRAAAEAERLAAIDAEFPRHGLVTRPQLTIRKEPDPEAQVIGWLRWGERIRLKDETVRTSTCNTGWVALHPRGWACAGQGIDVGEEPPESDVQAARRDRSLPYEYYFVKDRMTPQFHVLPARSHQRAAAEFAERYLEHLDAGHERRAARHLESDARPAAVARFLERGFMVAATEVVTREQRRFARTPTGAFVREAQLERRALAEWRGVELGEDRSLPLPFVRRNLEPRERRERWDGEIVFARDLELPVIERHTIPEQWVARERQGDAFYHRFEDPSWAGPRYARDWFVGVAEAIEAPFDVDEDEPWVHVSLRHQTLVLYRGETPTFATLVSTGMAEHETPTGVFHIRKKMVTDTMADLGPDAGDESYRIQDVPWTMYFEGSFALHAAFWHNRFGVQRSHGCINLSPADAHRIFRETWPQIPDGWHGVTTHRSGFRASRIVVTED